MPDTCCSYKNCRSSRSKTKGIRMFRFPTANSDVWIARSGNPNLIGLSPSSLRKKILCEHHFQPDDILPSGRLLHGTLPTQYSPPDEEEPSTSTASSSHHSPSTSNSYHSPSYQVKRTAESPRRYLGKSNLSPIVEHPSSTPDEYPSPSIETSSATFSVEKVSISEWISTASPQRSNLVKAKKCLFQSPIKEKLLGKIESQNKNLASKRAKISRLRHKLLKTNEYPAGLKFKTKEAAIFFKMQGHRKRTPWTAEEKKFAATLFLRSPSTYRYLCKLFILPGESTMRHWFSTKKCFQTGFNKALFEKIKIKAESMNEMEKTCVLLFDEMAIKQCLEYSPNYDLIEGYQDIGSLGRNKKLAKEATVFMIRGLFYQWKLPIGYFVSDKGLMGSQTKVIIDDCLNTLTDAGLNVRATVCDQSTTNVKAYKALGVTVEKPYFFTNRGQKIVAFFDPPHLVKSLRNNLISNDFLCEDKIVSFNDIKQLFLIDRQSGSTRAAPQLTPAHIWPNPFQKMSVSLATQIFSHTTAAALKTVHGTGQLKSVTALNTAMFVSQINSLFDAMNSRTQFSKNPDACALSEKNLHILEIFFKSKNIFRTLKKLNSSVPRPPCFDGFMLTINAFSELLSTESCTYILTSRLSQDPLENFFSSVRQRGGWNRNPSVRVLRGTIRLLTIQQILEPPKTTSYDPDHDILLDLGQGWEEESTNSIRQSSESSSISSEAEEVEEETVFTSEDFNVVTLEECSTVYFAGYIAHTYRKKFNCGDCHIKMCESESQLSSRKELLILNRSFSNVKVSELSGLQTPSDRLLYVVEQAIKVFKRMFKRISHKRNVVKKLISATNKVVTVDAVTCPRCGERGTFILQHLFKVLVHKQCKWISSEVKKTAQEKLKILSHV